MQQVLWIQYISELDDYNDENTQVIYLDLAMARIVDPQHTTIRLKISFLILKISQCRVCRLGLETSEDVYSAVKVWYS